MKKKSLLFVLSLILLSVCGIPGVFAALVEQGYEIAGEDGDNDGVINDIDVCPYTSNGAIVIEAEAETELATEYERQFSGCSCEQILYITSQEGYFPCAQVLSCEESDLELNVFDQGEEVEVMCQENFCLPPGTLFSFPEPFGFTCELHASVNPCEDAVEITEEDDYCTPFFADSDEDGVPDYTDECAGTPPGNLTVQQGINLPESSGFEAPYPWGDARLQGCDCEQSHALLAQYMGMDPRENPCVKYALCLEFNEGDLSNLRYQLVSENYIDNQYFRDECGWPRCEQGTYYFLPSVFGVCENGIMPECVIEEEEEAPTCVGDADGDGVINELDICSNTPQGEELVTVGTGQEGLVEGCTCTQLEERSERNLYPCYSWQCSDDGMSGTFEQTATGSIQGLCSNIDGCYQGTYYINQQQYSEFSFACPENPSLLDPSLLDCRYSITSCEELRDYDEDGDGYLNSYDDCAGTQGQIISQFGSGQASDDLEYFLSQYGITPAVDWKGCDCEQIDSLIAELLQVDSLDSYPCFPEVRCWENIYRPIFQQFVVANSELCQQRCEGRNMITFTSMVPAQCSRGNLIEEVCANPTIEEDHPECIALIEEQENLTEELYEEYNISEEIPVLEGSVRVVEDGPVTAIFTKKWTYQLELGEEIFFEFLALLDKNYFANTQFETNLGYEGEELEIISFEDGQGLDEPYYYKKWKLPSDEVFNGMIELHYRYIDPDTLEQINSESYVVLLQVTESQAEAGEELIELEETIIGDEGQDELDETEEAYIESIVEEAIQREAVADVDIDVVKENIKTASKHLRVNKEIKIKEVDEQKITTFEFHIEAKDKPLRNVVIFEEIPKEVAESVSEIRFATEPTRIIRDDPLIMWHFEEVDERVDLSYEVDKEVTVTGNTIITVQEVISDDDNYLNIIIPLIVIPFLAFSFILIPRFIKDREK